MVWSKVWVVSVEQRPIHHGMAAIKQNAGPPGWNIFIRQGDPGQTGFLYSNTDKVLQKKKTKKNSEKGAKEDTNDHLRLYFQERNLSYLLPTQCIIL